MTPKNRTAPPDDPAEVAEDRTWIARATIEQQMSVVYASELDAFRAGARYRRQHGPMDRGEMVKLSLHVEPETIERLAWQVGWCWEDAFRGL